MKLRILMMTLTLSISSQVFSESSIYVLYDFSGSYHNPTDQVTVIKREKVLSKLDTFIRNLYPILPQPTNLTVIPIRESGLVGGALHEFCLNITVFPQNNSDCVTRKSDLRVKLRIMKKSIQDYGVYSATDISGALKQTEFYLKSQPTDKESIVIILSDMAEFQMDVTVSPEFKLPNTKVLIVWADVTNGQNLDGEVARIKKWAERIKEAGAKKVEFHEEKTNWQSNQTISLLMD